MRQSFGQLQSMAQTYCLNDTSAATLTFLKREINQAQTFIMSKISEYITERSQTTPTVASQQYYHLPVDCIQVDTIQVTIGNVKYVLEPISSSQQWNKLNAIQFQGTAFPKYFIIRKRDFGIWPIPQQNGNTIEVVYNQQIKPMTASDFTQLSAPAGTVTVTNGSATISHSNAGFTASMVGRWLYADPDGGGDGMWYKVSGFTNTSLMTLETNYAGSTATLTSYIIGETPEIPDEGHELLAYFAAMKFFSGPRQDVTRGNYWTNMFWTGDGANSTAKPGDTRDGLLALVAKYSKRADSHVVKNRNKGMYDLRGDTVFSERIIP